MCHTVELQVRLNRWDHSQYMISHIAVAMDTREKRQKQRKRERERGEQRIEGEGRREGKINIMQVTILPSSPPFPFPLSLSYN